MESNRPNTLASVMVQVICGLIFGIVVGLIAMRMMLGK